MTYIEIGFIYIFIIEYNLIKKFKLSLIETIT